MTVFVPSTSGIVFNPIAGAITDHSQSAKYMDPYLSSRSVEDRGHCTAVLILPKGLIRPGEPTHDMN